MAVKIRLKRIGKKRDPHYRIVVADSRTHRDGKVIEEIGRYVPTTEPSTIVVDSARAQYWLSVGAQPTEQAAVLLKITGDMANANGEKKNTLRSPVAKEAFSIDTKKKSVLLPKVEKPVKVEEAPVAAAPQAEAPATEVAAETLADVVAEAAPEAVAQEAVAPEAAAEAPAETVAEAVAEEVAAEAVVEVAVEEVVAEVAVEEVVAEAVAEEAPVADVVAEAVAEEVAAEDAPAEEPKA